MDPEGSAGSDSKSHWVLSRRSTDLNKNSEAESRSIREQHGHGLHPACATFGGPWAVQNTCVLGPD